MVIRRQLRRRHVVPFFRKLSPCLVGVEACATSHHRAHELLALGHRVRIMTANYVKPCVKRNKNDAADAEAIAGAMSVIRHGRKTNFEKNPWLADLVRCKPSKVAAVALANKNARTAWALLATGETYRQPELVMA